MPGRIPSTVWQVGLNVSIAVTVFDQSIGASGSSSSAEIVTDVSVPKLTSPQPRRGAVIARLRYAD
jgi:hypothetical protein